MGKDTKVVTHERINLGTGIFYKRMGKGTIVPYLLGTHCHLLYSWSTDHLPVS